MAPERKGWLLYSPGLDRRDEDEDLSPYAFRLWFPGAIEKQFQKFYRYGAVRVIRPVLAGFLLGFMAFGISDFWGMPNSREQFWWIRYGVICPLYALALYLSFQPKWYRRLPEIVALVFLIGGLGVVSIGWIAQSDESSYKSYAQGLVFIILGVQLCRVTFWKATVVGWAVTLAYLLTTTMWQLPTYGIPTKGEIAGSLFFLSFINIAGMVMGYSSELSSRIDFIHRRALVYERRKSERLLKNVLPQEIAYQLKRNPEAIAQEYDDVSILFADIVGFTQLSERLSPSELVGMLDEVFSQFDRLVEEQGLEKIKTIGDCYMVAGGVPKPKVDHAIEMVRLGVRMLRCVERFSQEYDYDLNLRIGIHSGSVVAGVIGRRKYLYDLWGDTVNTASRMESHGTPGRIQITCVTHELVRSAYDCESMG
ncbi:MAG: adenylate/guanylate cyclase domain-containing protein [Alkalinema sp. RU_4_3]|nr:adenylate/guanylate cyclase domain-containing protein [Alkalinema sp. RU_4_3]